MRRKLILIILGVLLLAVPVLAQDMKAVLNQATEIYGLNVQDNSGLVGGFSVWGLMGGLIFGCIGFVAFVYGKKNAAFVPMVVGLLLMGFPYFVRGTLALYLVGIALVAALYFFRN